MLRTAQHRPHSQGPRRGVILRQRRVGAVAARGSLPVDVAYSVVERAELLIVAPSPEYRYDFRALVSASSTFRPGVYWRVMSNTGKGHVEYMT